MTIRCIKGFIVGGAIPVMIGEKFRLVSDSEEWYKEDYVCIEGRNMDIDISFTYKELATYFEFVE